MMAEIFRTREYTQDRAVTASRDVPDHISQRVVGVVPVAQQRRHHQRVQQRDGQTEHRGQAEQDGQDQDPGSQEIYAYNMGTPLSLFFTLMLAYPGGHGNSCLPKVQERKRR